MKVKIVAILSAVILCILAPFTIVASADSVRIFEYNDFVTDVVVDGDNDIVTLTLPLNYVMHRFKDNQSNVYQNYYGVTHSWGAEPYSIRGITYTDQIYLLGNNYINARDIPDDTVITYTLVIDTKNTVDNASVGSSYSGLATAFACGRDIHYTAKVWNAGTVDFNSVSFKSGQEFQVSTTFTKPSGVVYLDPMIQIQMQTNSNQYVECSITVKNVSLTMSVKSLQRLQAMTGQTNKILSEILSGSAEHQSKAEEYSIEVNENISDASEVLDVLDDMSKPNVDDLGDQVDVFSIVGEEEVEEYTSLFAQVMQCEIVVSFLMLSILGAFVSYVLFGKKG